MFSALCLLLASPIFGMQLLHEAAWFAQHSTPNRLWYTWAPALPHALPVRSPRIAEASPLCRSSSHRHPLHAQRSPSRAARRPARRPLGMLALAPTPVSLFLPWDQVPLDRFSRLHICVLIDGVCFSLFDKADLAGQTPGPPASLQMSLQINSCQAWFLRVHYWLHSLHFLW